MVTAQIEKELLADVYINRNKTITHATFESSIFHGYQNLLIGQPALSSIDITSRIYGFCGGAHQQAAVMALEHLSGSVVPPNAHILRSIIHAAEIVQNSIKWFYTSFAPDLAHPSFKSFELYQAAQERFQVFKGTSFRQGLVGATYPISLYSAVAGRWPHAEFVVPGGVNAEINPSDIDRWREIIQDFKYKWIEPILLNGSIEELLEIDSWQQMISWVEESDQHKEGDLGLFLRTGLEYGLDGLGGGKNPFLSFGAFWNEQSKLGIDPINHHKSVKLQSGILAKAKYLNVKPADFIDYLDNNKVGLNEEVLSQMTAYEVGSLSRMLMLGRSSKKKHVLNNQNLIKDTYEQKGSSVFLRAFARLYEIVVLSNFIEKRIDELDVKGVLHTPTALKDGIGIGMTEAPRGSLAHLVELKEGMICRYQILAPTIANINVGANDKRSSALGKALIGLTIKDLEHPIEVGLIARSFDSCLRCTINFKKSISKNQISQVVV